MHGGVSINKGLSQKRGIAGPALLEQSFLAEKGVIVGDATTPQEHHRVREPERGRPGTCSGTGTGYHPTALPTVAPYGPPVPDQVPGLVLDTRLLQARRILVCPYGNAYRRGGAHACCRPVRTRSLDRFKSPLPQASFPKGPQTLQGYLAHTNATPCKSNSVNEREAVGGLRVNVAFNKVLETRLKRDLPPSTQR